jgi:hypothetical protein
LADGFGGGTATQQQGAVAKLSDGLDRFWPNNITAQHMGWGDRLGCGGGAHDLAGWGAP